MNDRAKDSDALLAIAAVKNPLLHALGERVRTLRARRGLTRKVAAATADISERHFANLEYGIGNASILILQQVANALQCSLAEMVGDVTTSSSEWLLIRELLENRTDEDLRRARRALVALFSSSSAGRDRHGRIALIGLRGAGKSTLGQMLADSLDVPFIELSRELEKIAGCTVREIHDLYGSTAYRRYERRALDEVVQLYPEAVIATPGGIVSEPATFNLLLEHCVTVWVKATPEEHMQRVLAQGDMRPMAASHEAMDDLRRILAGREGFYSKADHVLDTSNRSLADGLMSLRKMLASAGTGRSDD